MISVKTNRSVSLDRVRKSSYNTFDIRADYHPMKRAACDCFEKTGSRRKDAEDAGEEEHFNL